MKEIEIQPFKLILKFVNKGVKKHEFTFYQVQNIEHSLCLLMKPFTKAISYNIIFISFTNNLL